MPVTDEQMLTLERRVTVLEREVEGEKTVTRQILKLGHDNAENIANVYSVVRQLQVEALRLRADLPEIVATAVGFALRK